MFKSYYLLISLLFYSLTCSATEMYQCVENGKKIFSQIPCSETANPITINGTDRNISLTEKISLDDKRYLCNLVYKSKKQATYSYNYRRSNSYDDDYDAYHSYNYRSYEYDDSDSLQSKQVDYVLSHISNISEIAKNDPSLYRLIKEWITYSFPSSESSNRIAGNIDKSLNNDKCLKNLNYIVYLYKN